MVKQRNRTTLRISAGLLSVSVLILVAVFIRAMHNAIFGFAYDFRGTEADGLAAFIRTFLLYAWVYWPIVILQIVLFAAAVIFFIRWLQGK